MKKLFSKALPFLVGAAGVSVTSALAQVPIKDVETLMAHMACRAQLLAWVHANQVVLGAVAILALIGAYQVIACAARIIAGLWAWGAARTRGLS